MNINSMINSNSFDAFNIQNQQSKWRGNVTGWARNDRDASASGGAAQSGSALQSYMANLKNFSSSLNSITSDLMSSTFRQMAGNSSDTEAVTVSVTNQNNAFNFYRSNGSVSMTVGQIATAQQNTGERVSGAAVSDVDNGTNRFSIEMNNKTFTFEINVNASDTNRTVQQKMSDAINRSSVGVNASVNVNAQGSALVLTGRETGENQQFNIQDIAGNAVSRQGLNDTANIQTAQNAQYTVNGAQRESAVNTVEIGSGLRATLVAETDEPVQITAAQDSNAINNAIRSMVNSFNQLREAAVNNNGDRGAQRLQQRLDNTSMAFITGLNRIGISYNNNGYLQINEERLASSITDGSAERVLGSSGGFTRSLNQTARTADTNPNSFISRQSREGTNGIPMNENFFESIRLSAYQQNFANQWNTVGMLFSMGI
jgi:flagellar capping protein FliD